MIICKIIGHNYKPNLTSVDRMSRGISNTFDTIEEKRLYTGVVCVRCGDPQMPFLTDELLDK